MEKERIIIEERRGTRKVWTQASTSFFNCRAFLRWANSFLIFRFIPQIVRELPNFTWYWSLVRFSPALCVNVDETPRLW